MSKSQDCSIRVGNREGVGAESHPRLENICKSDTLSVDFVDQFMVKLLKIDGKIRVFGDFR